MGGKYQLSHADEISVIAYEHHLSMNGRKSSKSNSPLFRVNQWGRVLPFAIIKLNSSRFKTEKNAVPDLLCERSTNHYI